MTSAIQEIPLTMHEQKTTRISASSDVMNNDHPIPSDERALAFEHREHRQDMILILPVLANDRDDRRISCNMFGVWTIGIQPFTYPYSRF